VTFCGYHTNLTTGLNEIRNRIYDPLTGTWHQVEPGRVYRDGYNFYDAYFVPNGVDPWGLAMLQNDVGGRWYSPTIPQFDFADDSKTVGLNYDRTHVSAGNMKDQLSAMTSSDILFYSGHGVQELDKNGKPTGNFLGLSTAGGYISLSDIAGALDKTHGKAIGLVIIFACDACKARNAVLQHGVKCVICTNREVDTMMDSGGETAMMQGLFKGQSLSGAVGTGNNKNPGGDMLRLYCNSSTDTSKDLGQLLGVKLNYKK